MDPLAGLLSLPLTQLSASELHSRIKLLEDATRACRAELQRRPSQCQEPAVLVHPASSSCILLQLSHDELGVVAHELCDPLRPLLVANLSSTAKGLRVPMQAALAQLKHQHQEVAAFVAGMKRGFGDLDPVGIEELNGLTVLDTNQDEFTLAHWRGLSTLIACGSLPVLNTLSIQMYCDDEALLLLAAGIRCGGMPSLTRLDLSFSLAGFTVAGGLVSDLRGFGDQATIALADALTEQPMPALRELRLSDNEIGDPGLLALAPVLRQMPALEILDMYLNNIGDEGFAALIAPPMTGALESLKYLDIGHGNRITDASCLALASLLRSGALSALEEVSLHQPSAEDNDSEPFSPAHREIFAAREGLRPIEYQSHLLSEDEEELGGL